MPVWEYKVITSGKGGFASPNHLESFLNQLGKEEWEILHFQTQPDNPLAFSGIARRLTQRDWTLEDAAAAAAKAEADKLRAEFEAKFKGATGGPADEKPEAAPDEPAQDFRRLRDTESDLDPDADDGEEDEWDKLQSEDELPTFFEAIRPHLRRNQRGPGMSAGVEHLAKKWNLDEDDVLGALKESGFAIPEDEDDPPSYLEYDGDLYWLNRNRRGELWINTKEKPRQVFRTVAGTPVAAEATAENGEGGGAEPSPEGGSEGRRERRRGREERPPAGPAEPLPEGPALLDRLLPQMRRNRDGSGVSGSLSFLSRAFRCSEADLAAALGALGLAPAATPEEKPAFLEAGERLWWLNRDHRGQLWINGRDQSAGIPEIPSAPSGEAPAAAEAASAEAASPAPADADKAVLGALRLLLQETKTGSFSAETGRLAEQVGRSPAELIGSLQAAGLKVPEASREKPVFVEHGGEIFWLNRNGRDELWLNAKASKFSDGGRRPRKGRERDGDEPEAEPEPGS